MPDSDKREHILIEYFEKLRNNIEQYPERIAAADDHGGSLTFRELDCSSARMAAYLHNRGVRKGDFVIICLPRIVHIFSAFLGVSRIGAVFIMTDSYLPQERLAFIQKDCGARIIFREEDLEEMLRCEPEWEWTPADMHDPAFAIYTSGTTGTPKGVLHERGSFTENVMNFVCDGTAVLDGYRRFGYFTPLSFAALELSFIIPYYGISWYLAEDHRIRDSRQFYEFIQKNEIDLIFVPSGVIASLAAVPPSLKCILIGGDTAENIYSEQYETYNIYASGESAAPITMCRLTGKEERIPIGRSACGRVSLDSPDERGIGEIMVYTPYSRGYIGDEQLTARKYAGRVFHTGDYARLGKDGYYYYVGREDQMVKINGNRIEPAEVEDVLTSYCGVSEAVVKADAINGISTLAAFYTDTDGTASDSREMAAIMSRYLPEYMIPRFFIKLDEIPHNANGKTDLKKLRIPSVQSGHAADDTVDDIVRVLCRSMEKIFGLDSVSPDDNFFDLGGNSLCCLKLQLESKLEKLSTSMIYRGMTPDRIAELYCEAAGRRENGNSREMNECLITAEQELDYYEQKMFPESTSLCLNRFLRIKDTVDKERFAAAANEAVFKSGALMSSIEERDGKVYQRYTPELFVPSVIETVSEEQLNGYKKTLVQPIDMFRGHLYDLRLFDCEGSLYMFFEVHHLFFDGTSFEILLRKISDIYNGIGAEHDSYYKAAHERIVDKTTEEYREAQAFFEGKYSQIEYDVYPKPDYSEDGDLKSMIVPIGISVDEMTACTEHFGITANVFFIAATIQSIAEYNCSDGAYISWLYNGRENEEERNTVGLLFREYPIAVSLSACPDPESLFAEVMKQLNTGMRHSAYPADALHEDAYETTVHYIGKMLDVINNNSRSQMFETCEELSDSYEETAKIHMEVVLFEDGDDICMDLYYNEGRYSMDSIYKYADLYKDICRRYLKCARKDKD